MKTFILAKQVLTDLLKVGCFDEIILEAFNVAFQL